MVRQTQVQPCTNSTGSLSALYGTLDICDKHSKTIATQPLSYVEWRFALIESQVLDIVSPSTQLQKGNMMGTYDFGL